MLTQAQIDFFNENGFLRVENVYSQAEIAKMSEDLAYMMDTFAFWEAGWRGDWRKREQYMAVRHRLGKLEHIRGPEVEPHLPTKQYSIRDAVSVPANPGDVVFFSIYTIHGSALNRSGRWRRLVRVGLRDPHNPQTEGLATGRPGIMVKGVRPHIEGQEVDVYKNWTLPGVPLHGEQKDHTPVTADFTR